MGTFASITLEEEHKQEIQKGFQRIKAIEKSLSSYDTTALLYQLNKHRHVQADDYLLEAIQKSKTFYNLSQGYFDISIGSITKKLYHFGEQEELPSKEALNKANINIQNIHIKENNIRLESDITLDLGGMGKGFAVDKIADYYREQNISHGIIALSGDIQALHPTTVYIHSPFSEKPLATLETLYPNTSISTSGTYRRFVKNQEHHHLINPKNKKQGKSFVSITLISQQNNALIDAMATAIGVMPFEKAMTFLKEHDEIGYVLLKADEKVIYGNLENKVKIIFNY
jgi:thiamine biosynthesis lipoprotein